MAAEEGAAWTILHPQFHLVAPAPTLLFPFGYAVARGDSQLLLYLNTWLLNTEGDGTIDGLRGGGLRHGVRDGRGVNHAINSTRKHDHRLDRDRTGD
jgi:hypothetical protein